MGYYTEFTVGADDIDDTKLSEILNQKTGYEFNVYNGCYLNGKWYDWELDMTNISEAHPNTLFTVDGAGAESGDMWVSYFKNGKRQHCAAMIVFDEFDESKMV
jgi:hypothetical protein